MNAQRKRVLINLTAFGLITGWRKTVSVKAELDGPFGVHVCPFSKERTWKLTHVATGMAAATGPTRHAVAHASRLLQGLDIAWDFSDATAVNSFPAEIRQQIDVIR